MTTDLIQLRSERRAQVEYERFCMAFGQKFSVFGHGKPFVCQTRQMSTTICGPTSLAFDGMSLQNNVVAACAREILIN